MNKNYIIGLFVLFLSFSFVSAYPDGICWTLSTGLLCLNSTGFNTPISINASEVLNPPWALNSSLSNYYTKTLSDARYLQLTDQRFNETSRIDSLNLTKLDITDQRYNDSARINSLNSTKANIGSCASGSVVQNTTTSGVQCVSLVAGSGTVTNITSGSGLIGGSITTSGTIALNDSYVLFLTNVYNSSTRIDTLNSSLITEHNRIDALNISKLDVTDQRYNDSAKIDLVNSSLQAQINSINSTAIGASNYSQFTNVSNLNVNTSTLKTTNGLLDIVSTWFTNLFYQKSEVYNKTEIDSSLNLKLNISDQRYNETARINTINSTLVTQTSRIDSLNTTVLLHTSQISNLNNLSLANVVSSIGNWSLDKPNYATNSYVGNVVTNLTSINTTVTLHTSQISGIIANITQVNTTLTTQTSSITDLNTTKLSLTDQRFNDTALANSKLNDTTSTNSYITITGTTNKSIAFQESVLNTTLANYLATTFYNVTSINISIGTPQGVFSSVKIEDDIDYNISEVNSDLDFFINATNITVFNQIVIKYKSIAGETDIISFSLWDNTTSSWEGYDLLSGNGGGYITKYVTVTDPSEHILNGLVQMRFTTTNVGARTDKWGFDYIAVLKGFGSASSVETDPYAVHRDGLTPLTANWATGGYNITGTQLLDAIDQRYNDTLIVSNVDSRVTLLNTTKLQNGSDASLNSVYVSGGFGSIGISLTDGNGWFDGSLYILGNITGTTITQQNFNGSMIPSINNTFSVGSPLMYWLNGYYGTIYEGGSTLATKYATNTKVDTINTSINIKGLGFNLTTELKSYFDTIYYTGTTIPYQSSAGGWTNTSTTTSTGLITNITGVLNTPNIAGGTSATTGTLQFGTIRGDYYIKNSGTTFNFINDVANAPYVWKNNTQTFMYLNTTTGSLGIGTQTITQRLTVAGNISASELIYEGGTSLNTKYNDSARIDSLNTTVVLHTSQISNLNNLSLANVVSSIGNWSLDKPNYATNTYVGNVVTNLTSINTTVTLHTSQISNLNNLSLANIVASIGNWSLDKPNYALDSRVTTINSTLVTQTSRIDSLNTTVLLHTSQISNLNNLSLANVVSSIGNWSLDKPNYATNSYVGNVVTNLTSINTTVTLHTSQISLINTTKLQNSTDATFRNLTITDRIINTKYKWYLNATYWDCYNGTGTIQNRGNTTITC